MNSGSRAAIAGGITAVFEMPNTNPPTANMIEFKKKLDLAKKRMYCNYAFYFGATADNSDELSRLSNLEGCCGIKLFAGSSTGNLLVANEKDIEKVFQSSKVLQFIRKMKILNQTKLIKKECTFSSIWRSEECAISSTRRIVKLAKRYKTHIYPQQNKGRFLSQHIITFEITSTPNNFRSGFNKLGTLFQMNPPIRDKSLILWFAVK